MPFVKGQSGNPAGRPPGARNRKTLIADGVFEANAERIAAYAIERALMGDNAALRLCIGVLLPRATERPVPFPLPAITSAQDVERAAVSIAAAVGTGDLTPREALELLRVVDRSMKIVEAARAAQQAAADEAAAAAAEPEPAVATAAQTADQSEAAAASGSLASEQPAQTTMKYNEPIKATESAGEPAEQRLEKTTKYNADRQDRREDGMKRAA